MSASGRVILVDDEHHVREAGKQTLELAGYDVECFEGADGVLDRLSRAWLGVVITDVRMPRVDGMTLLRRIVEVDGDLPVVVITGHGDVPLAVEAIRSGAYDFIEKPFPAELLVDAVSQAMEKRRRALDNRTLRAQQGGPGLAALVIGRSDAIERVRQQILAVAETDADVLICGETGTGKELTARALHNYSRRVDRPFVAINCGALPATIFESELFGHEAGAFTGAQRARIGKFEHANGGTVFLDEIESMPLDLQVKLLRVLEERSVERLGSNRPIPLDLRIVAATKIDLRRAADRGAFREDLLYRLNVVPIDLPPLRERLDDVPILFAQFVQRAAERLRRDAPDIPSGVVAQLLTHHWPGNVRELRNAAERFALGLPIDGTRAASDVGVYGLSERVEAFEKSLILRELAHQKGDIKATHEALGLPRKTLYDKMAKYGLRRGDFVAVGDAS
jgi:two-component system C4-dicarboxylate transport response regulator DctD